MAEQNARLVYSTGNETVEVPKPSRRQSPAQQSGRPPEGRGVRLRLERRASDRLATLVSGLPGSEQQLASFLKQLKSACGTGGTLKDGVLELQGDQREKVEAALRARGIPSKRAGG